MTHQPINVLEKDRKIGFLFASLAAFSYSSMAFMAKLATEVSPSAMIFFRSLICLLIFFPQILKNKSFKVNNPRLIILRAILGFFCLSCFYYSAKHLKLVDSVLLINTAPLFIPLVILLWDKIKVPKHRLFAICVGFTGIVCILKPNFNFFNFAGFVGLISGILMAWSLVVLRKLSKTESTENILLSFFGGTLILGFVPMVIQWKPFEDPFMWLYLLGVGLLGFLFQYLTTKAYTYISPTRVSVISYFSIVISGVYGWVFYGNSLDVLSILGIILVIIGGIFVVAIESTVSFKKYFFFN